MRVAVGQPRTKLGQKQYNLQSISAMTRSLARRDVDLACFPELCTTGYALYERWPEFAEPVPGPTTEVLGKAAADAGTYLVFGMPEIGGGGAIYDSAVLIDPKGEVAGTYRKVHLWDREREFFARGDDFTVFETKHGKLGIGICYDLEFPEAARAMAVGGARLLLFPSAQPRWMDRHIDVYAASRAAENCAFVAFSNLSGREPRLNYLGHSRIVSPGCEIMASVKNRFGAAVADLDFKELRKYKSHLPYLEQRVPSSYR
jgi:predicted amidohydrolase